MNTKNGHHDQDLDRRFRQGLREHTVTPASDAWARVQAGQKKRRPFIFWLLPLLLVLLVGSTGAYWLTTEKESVVHITPEIPEENVTLLEESSSEEPQNEPKLDTVSKKVEELVEVERTEEKTAKEAVDLTPSTPKKQAKSIKKQVKSDESTVIAKQAIIRPDSNLVTTLPSLQLLDSIPTTVKPKVTEPEPDTVNQIRLVISRGSSAGSREEERAQEQKPQKKKNLLKRLWKFKKEGIRVDEIIQSPKNK
ncbi:MAG: hypothetical protein AAF740_00715 [Bacteroidota bacterium]